MLTRREFLKTSSLVSMSPFVPGMLAPAAEAAGARPDARVLVVIQLDGGNDGINTVVPYGDDAYGRARNQLRLDPGKLHKIADGIGLHPDLRAATELFDDGRLAIVQGTGYPNPDRSHFRSMRIWQTARCEDAQQDGYGWLGRALDVKTARRGGSDWTNAVYVGDQDVPLAVVGRRSAVTALSRADDLTLDEGVDSTKLASRSPAEGSLDQFVSRQVLSAYTAAAEFEKQQAKARQRARSSYSDTELAAQLAFVSELLQSGSRARVFYTVQTGYDTHAAQLDTHARLLRAFGEAVKAFLDDLRGLGLADRVVVLAFSEFGRRVRENGSQGTDHGTAGPVFLAGNPVRGGLCGDAPDLSDLVDGDLKPQIDFRQVYATILDQWLAVSSPDILGGSFETLPLLGAT